ncbi:MAG: hypothetical protein RBS73_17705 [Prolixibacteraceae bacterium]|jgi:hypothetical protein|nr:hypothetical protein [Prolixibacteraceae bacterium]
MLHLERYITSINNGIKKFNDFLLRKGTGILKIKVFVTTSASSLNSIVTDHNFSICAVNDKVFSDILMARGSKKCNQLRKIVNRGGYGLSIYQANELAAYGWIELNKGKFARRIFTSFEIPCDSAHIFECYTVKKFRGQKLYPAIVYKLVDWTKSEQIKNIYIDTVAGNYAAEKGIINLGFDYISLQTKLLFLNKVILQYDSKR